MEPGADLEPEWDPKVKVGYVSDHDLVLIRVN